MKMISFDTMDLGQVLDTIVIDEKQFLLLNYLVDNKLLKDNIEFSYDDYEPFEDEEKCNIKYL